MGEIVTTFVAIAALVIVPVIALWTIVWRFRGRHRLYVAVALLLYLMVTGAVLASIPRGGGTAPGQLEAR